MKAIFSCILVAIAIVVTIALAPMSTWIFRNQIDLLADSHRMPDVGVGGEIGAFIPEWLGNPETYNGEGKTLELAHALYSEAAKRNPLLDTYNQKYPNDVIGWAVTVRRTCMMGVHFPIDAKGNVKPLEHKVYQRLQ